MDILDMFPPIKHVCYVCASKDNLMYCTGCRAVLYCGIEHQRHHRKNHKVACNDISKTRKDLDETDSTRINDFVKAKYQYMDSLLQIDTTDAIEKALEICTELMEMSPENEHSVQDIVPNLYLRLGREQDCYDFIKWWSFDSSKEPAFYSQTGRYLSIKDADALEPIEELDLNSLSLSHLATLTLLKTKLHLDLSEYEVDEEDDLGFLGRSTGPKKKDLSRDIGEVVQKAMDFLDKKFDVEYETGSSDSEFENDDDDDDNMEDVTDIPAEEDEMPYIPGRPYLPTGCYIQFSDGEYRVMGPNAPKFRRVVDDDGRITIVRDDEDDKSDSSDGDGLGHYDFVEERTAALEEECQSLSAKIHSANPYFWDILTSEGKIGPVDTMSCSPGSKEEAVLAASRCKAAWDESEDALLMAQGRTEDFVNPYTSPTEPTGLELKRGTGRCFANAFESNESPKTLFPPTPIAGSHEIRFVHVHDSQAMLVFVDGACSNNGQPDARAGWAAVYGPQQDQDQGFVSGRLEAKGPFDEEFTATSNRAELRAAIAALRMCDWTDSNCQIVVLATDSTYVTDGMTKWARKWIAQGWKLKGGGKVKNRDLWELLLGEVERCDYLGLEVRLWRIHRSNNVAADVAAKDACELPAEAQFSGATIKTSPSIGQETTYLALATELPYSANTDSYLSLVPAKCNMKVVVSSEEAALSMLAQATHPLVIIAADGAVTKRKELSKRVIDHVRRGATLVMTGWCMSFATPPEITSFFKMSGLPVKLDDYTRDDIKLQRDAVGSRLLPTMDGETSLKARFMKGMPTSTMWYVSKTNPETSPVVFVPLGQGNVGIIGDVTQNKNTDWAFLAMCGLGGEAAGQ